MKLLLIFIVSILLAQSTVSQWFGSNTSSSFSNEAIDIEIDASGNHYVAGYFTGSLNFSTTVSIPASNGNADIYVAKYSPTGVLLWVKQYGGTGNDRPVDLALDNLGNCYVTGQYSGQMIVGPTTLNSVNSSRDIFILKLNSAGVVQWVKSEGGSSIENAAGITLDNANNVILTGQFEGTTSLGAQNFTSTLNPVTNEPSFDFFVAKYDQNGLVNWVKTGNAKYDDRGIAVACDSQNSLYITGQFSDTLIFNTISYTNIVLNAGFLLKLTPSGATSFFYQIKAGSLTPHDIEVNSLDQPVVIGDYTGTLNYFGPTGLSTVTNSFSKKIFALKTTSSGNFLWGKTLGSADEISARSISIDALNNNYITGYFKCALTQLHTPSTAIFNSIGYRDGYLWRLDNNGTTNYVKQFGGKANDEGLGVAIQTNNTPVVCGNYQEDLFFPFHPTITYSFGVQGLFNGGPHHYLSGDNSRNSFLSNAIGAGSEDINFFENTPVDSLFGTILPEQDTLHFCQSTTLSYNPKTNSIFGPDYTYLWSNGATTPTISVNSTNTFSVIVKRKDECVSGGDTIYTVLHLAPPMPSKTDNILQAVNEFPPYTNYELCYPDSVEIWFNNLCGGCSIAVGPAITDTLPHYYTQSNTYTVSVTDEYCTNTQNFSVLITDNQPYDSIVPYLYFVNDVDETDTVVFCFGEILTIHIYDSLTNPTTIVGQFDSVPTFQENMTVSNSSCECADGRTFEYAPTATGWYTFNYAITTGFNNYCGVDTTRYETSDSIYIIVHPLPTTNSIVSGSSDLCPNSTPYLTVSPTTEGFQWVGPGIIWQSLDNDSIQISSAGNYSYTGILTDSTTGCTNNYSSNLSISLLEPPLISSDPADGVVCLNDSITLTVPPNYASYNWEGPFGGNLSATNTLTTTLQGLYSCEVTDFQGCVLTSLQFEVMEFSTPSLFVDPLTILCPNEQTSIYVIYDGNAQIQWLNPMNNNSPIITVSQPGTYICQIQQCGLTFIDSVTIIDGAFQPPIFASDSLLCLGETALITTTAGFSEYLWSTGQTGINSIPVTSSGIYSVLVTNAYGCVVTSASISIQEDVSAAIPNVVYDTICAGFPLALSTPQNNIVSWFNQDTVLIETSSLLFLNAVYSDTLFLAAYLSNNCPLTYQSIPIEVVENPTSFIHLDDSVLCFGEELLFTNPSVETSLDWFIADSLISTNGSFSLSFNSVPNTALILSASYSNSCFTDTLNFPIQLISPPLFSLQLDTLVLCPGSQEIVNYSPNYPTIIWTFPNGDVDTLSALSLTNDAENGYLIATAIDQNGCQSVSDSALLLSSVTEIEILSNSLQPCINDTVELRVTPDSSPLTWTFPNGTFSSQNLLEIILSPNNTGLYIVRYIDPLNCPISDSFLLTGQPLPTVVIPEDTLVCVGSIFTLPEIAGSYYVWEQVGETTSFPVTVGGNYYLQTISANGCITYDTITLNTINCEDDLPNVITPNGDGINDFFYLEEATIFLNNQLVILNRWGLEIYNSKGYNNTFNGADVTDGVYFYSFTYDLSGKDPTVKRGFLTIIH